MEGLYGDIYLLEHKATKKLMVLKSIKKSKLKNCSAHFKKETEILQKLDHPNIYTIIDFYQDSQQYFIVSEYLQGGELFDFLNKKGVLNEQTTYAIMKVIFKAVNYLHKHGIIHRDIKPENLVFAKQDEIPSLKLIDFGTADFGDENLIFTNTLGTVYYVAPEVLKNKYDMKADIWSCGVVFYIMICGNLPFSGKRDQDIMDSILNNEPSFEGPEWSIIPEDLKNLVRRILVKDPSKRITLNEIFQHPWYLRMKEHKEGGVEWRLENLLKFQNNNKFQMMIKQYIVQNEEWAEEMKRLT